MQMTRVLIAFTKSSLKLIKTYTATYIQVQSSWGPFDLILRTQNTHEPFRIALPRYEPHLTCSVINKLSLLTV